MDEIRLLSATALLTLLIWVSADQLLTETDDLDVSISIKTETGSPLVIRPAENAPTKFRMTVSGRQADINELRKRGRAELTVPDNVLLAENLGSQELNLNRLFRDQGVIVSGCAVKRVDPETVAVHVDRRLEVTLPIIARPGNLEHAIPPRVDPDSATVTIMQLKYERVMSASPRLVVNAEEFLADAPEDEPVRIVGIPIKPDVESDAGTVQAVRVVPESVALSATLRRRRSVGTIPAVPIKFLSSANVLNRYRIEFRRENPDTISLTVVGPPDIVDKLVRGEQKTIAAISIGDVDALSAGTFQFYKPEFSLPPGVKIDESLPIESYEIRLVPRDSRPEDPGRND